MGTSYGKTIKPTQNLAFKKLFASKGNEDILAGLIEDFFGFAPEEITILKPYNISELRLMLQNANNSHEEHTRLIETICDVKADLVTANFTAEMQLRNHIAFDARSLYYPFLDFCEGYNSKGNKYLDLRPVYSLNILGESGFRHPAALKSFELYDPYLRIPMDNEYLRIVYLELNKDGARNEHQELWQKFFLDKELPDSAPEYIKKAKKVIDITNFGKEERDMMSAMEKAEADWESILLAAEAKGKRERSLEVARNMKTAGAEKAFILKVTGISEEDYNAL